MQITDKHIQNLSQAIKACAESGRHLTVTDRLDILAQAFEVDKSVIYGMASDMLSTPHWSDATPIEADLVTDDEAIEATIDARPYLVKMSEQGLKRIIEADGTSNSETDEIFWNALSELDGDAIYVQEYCEKKGGDVGWKCTISVEDVREWLMENRSEFYMHVSELFPNAPQP